MIPTSQLRIDYIKTLKDVEDCVDMYSWINDSNFMLMDRAVAIEKTSLAARRQKFLRVVRRGEKIIAAIWAEHTGSMHSNLRILNQQYFACNQKGVIAYRCVQMLHDAMIEYAEETDCHLAMSQASPYTPNNELVRILEKMGWQRRSFVAIWKTTQYPRSLA